MIAIGPRIREVRESLGIDRATLARDLGVTYQAIANLEYGSTGVSVERLYAIAEALGVSPRELLPE